MMRYTELHETAPRSVELCIAFPPTCNRIGSRTLTGSLLSHFFLEETTFYVSLSIALIVIVIVLVPA